jgi:hypothetical protein
LLPEVRKADAETLIVANGFSCRKQIELTTERRALHLAHLLELAQREADGRPPPRQCSERGLLPRERRDPTKTEALLVAGAVVALVGGAAWWLTRRPPAGRRRLGPDRRRS